ncbi:U3 snoRNP protein [Ophidiomyces ophidiicola]|nr:U3 snoRNP protein [Ophidiomyces ophidiicola]KAI2002162.1 U3 snoRNP protein [Ophidiomyces ophidiicola]KAI2115865.1 U3 snoRNP protein [Ophidiomyces ophidiicola]KAI2229040.1 U3 snoRNP protein [Ophidiomyces ophidiicola]KAI2383255.1 U3 snoRNP protein [Ophidiomyces ophidiicola]
MAYMFSPSAKRRKLDDLDEETNGSTNIHQQDVSTLPRLRKIEAFLSLSPANRLTPASGQFRPTLFKLQIDELISQLRFGSIKHLKSVEKVLPQLKSIIENVPESPEKPTHEAEEYLQRIFGVIVPFPEPRPQCNAQYKFEYKKPASINVAGSIALGTALKDLEEPSMDLVVTIPRAMIRKKDYLDYRYLYKRAYYIASIAAGIKDSKEVSFDLKYTYQDDDKLRPILLVTLNEGPSEHSQHSRVCIRILTTMEYDVFPVTHTMPGSNNIRRNFPGDDGQQSLTSFTAFYNATLRSESCITSYHMLLSQACTRCSAFRAASILGQAWLRQRGFGSSVVRGGFGYFEWATSIALLLETGSTDGTPLFSSSYSPYQIFKAMMQFLDDKDLTNPFIVLNMDTPHKIVSSKYPVLFDGKRGLNLLYKMTPWSYQLLRYEARMTLKMLNDPAPRCFDHTFIKRADYALCRFDQVVTLKSNIILASAFDSFSYCNSIYNMLSEALGDRAKLIHITCDDTFQWHVGPGKAYTETKAVVVGLILNSDTCSRIVDRGPTADDKQAGLTFRKFWGSKAELRRFNDGTIAESLVWSDHHADGSISQQIIAHILGLHFGLQLLTGPNLFEESHSIQNIAKSTLIFKPILEALRSLENTLRDIQGLPLAFRQLYGANPALRYSSLGNPTTQQLSLCPIDVILQLEGSSRWPDDLAAIQATKLSFLTRIGELLGQSRNAMPCKIGLESHSTRVQNVAFLDISSSPLATFRLRIAYEREQELLENQLRDYSLTKWKKEEAALALLCHQRSFSQQVQHTQAFQTLATRFPVLSSTIRVFKLWVNSHLLKGYFCDELLELLVCHVFLHPSPWSTPCTVANGLLRTLHLLANWNWQQEPLVLHIDDSLTHQDLNNISAKFTSWRKIDPLMNTVSFFIASTLDHSGVIWSRQAKPPRVIALRLQSLAKAAMEVVKQQGIDLRFSQLFYSRNRNFDFLLCINPKFVNDNRPVYRNLPNSNHISGRAAVVHFINELHRLYGSHILFFYDFEERNIVAGLWKPQSIKPRTFGLKLSYSSTPATGPEAGENMVVLRKDATLHAIATLGGDLIEKVQVNSNL